VASARLLFRRAADLGSADAAVQLGDTFDPERLRSLGVRGVSGDLQEAIRWYEKADELGASSAKARLMALSSR
jgi:TPR repeat protein